MQTFLRKLMQSVGAVTEKTIHRFQKQQASHSFHSVNSPEKTTEIPIAEMRLRKILEAVESQEVRSLIPSLSGKKVLHASETGTTQWEALEEKGAQSIVNFDVNVLGHLSIPPHEKIPATVKGHLEAAPFRDDSFDFLLCFSSTTQEHSLEWMKEIARLLKDGSRVVISFLHPYFEHQLNLKPGFFHEISQYFMSLRKAGIYVEEIREVKADPRFRSLLSGSAKYEKEFSQIEGIPLIVFFRGVRLKRR